MFEWYWILIIIATLVIVYVFIQTIVFFIMKKCMKKAYAELDKMAVYEKEKRRQSVIHKTKIPPEPALRRFSFGLYLTFSVKFGLFSAASQKHLSISQP